MALGHRRERRSVALVAVALTAALLAASAGSLFVGRGAIGAHDVLAALQRGRIDVATTLVWDQRVPRAALGILVGLALGVAASLLQNVLRNTFADPGILGVTSGAALGVAGVGAAFGGVVLPLRLAAALAGAAVMSAAVLALWRRTGGDTPTLILLGVAATAVGQSAVLALAFLEPLTFDLTRSWNAGSLSGRGWSPVWLLLPAVAVGGAGALALSRSLDVAALGDDAAAGLGVDPLALRVGALCLSAALTAAATAAAGPFAFAGLIATQTVRPIARHSQLALTLLAPLAAAMAIVVADTGGRVLLSVGEVPAALAVSIVGGPALMVAWARRR